MSKFNLLAASEFGDLVKRIGTTQNALNQDIQLAAVMAIAYANTQNDVRKGGQLLDVLGKSLRKDAMLKFLEVHGNFAWLKVDKKLAFFKNPQAVDFKDERAVELLMATPWNEAKKPAELKSQYDVDEMFTKFLASTRATIKKAQEAGIKVKNMDLLNALSSTASHFDEVREDQITRTAKLNPVVLARVEMEMDWDDALTINNKMIEDKAAIDRERCNHGVTVPPLALTAIAA